LSKTPYEQGKIDGQWTEEQIKQCGFASPEDCLAHQEKVYQEEMQNLSSLERSYAIRHAEYMEGLINAEMESLNYEQPRKQTDHDNL